MDMNTKIRTTHAISTVFACLLMSSLPNATASDEQNFKSCIENTRRAIEANHLICLVDVSDRANPNEKKSFRYDHYPEVERIQMKDGTTYARKKGNGWLKSGDWGKTGKKVGNEKAGEFEAMIALVNAPLGSPVSKDPSQGANVIELIKREPHDSTEYVFYEMHRENSTGVSYPKFIFLKFPNDAEDRLLLKGFAGPMYSGGKKVWVNSNYEYMILANIKQ